jgi:hypothetical protein
MKVRHTITIHSLCPVNGDLDRYVCHVYPSSLLYCEAVRDAVDELTTEPVTQEGLTQALANKLGCRVCTEGTHCRGRVTTKVVCHPQPQEV